MFRIDATYNGPDPRVVTSKCADSEQLISELSWFVNEAIRGELVGDRFTVTYEPREA